MRIGKEPVTLSPVFYVASTYLDKADKYIRLQGNSYFAEGDLTFSVMNSYKKYGAIPEKVYKGILPGENRHDHFEMDNLLLAMVESVGTSGYGKIKSGSWKESMEATLNAYLGTPPDSFTYEGESFTPTSFAEEMIGINPDDYIEITSYNHHPLYQKINLDIPANWNDNLYLNLPINDFKAVIDSALKQGYSLCWDGDVSESGFREEEGIAELSGRFKKDSMITQEIRQFTFDNFTTRDDHNMHLIGLANDNNGNAYYILKNSNGNNNDCGGYIYMSEKYLLLKTISVMVHKSAIPGMIPIGKQ